MYVVAADPVASDLATGLDERSPVAPPEDLRYGVPCVFKGCAGVYHPAGGTIGVVLCSPWGFEDLSMRKAWRLLAERIAKAGFPCIRFDYPGTGDSLGTPTDVRGLGDWVEAIHDAAEMLRKSSGVRRFVFLGQSLGAALAVLAAEGRGDVVGLQLIAPVVKGRAYARELAATATMVAEKIGIAPDLAPDEAVSVLGFPLSRALVEELKGIDLLKIDALGASHVVVYDQADRKAGAEVAEHMRRLGANVRLETVAPYHLMVSDSTAIQPLPVEAEIVVAALRAAHPAFVASFVPPPPAFPSALVGSTFREEAVRFGPDGALFGMLCRPLRERAGTPAFVLLNRGLNAHIGWRRVSVEHARGLAAAGITSLRIDVAGLGESRDAPNRPVNLIYSDLLLPDISAAVDVLAARGHTRVALAGVCSGAYMALCAAHADPRVTDVVSVNPQRFVWNPAENVDDVIRYGLRSMNDYVGDIRNRDALRKLIRSRKRVVPAMHFLAKRGLRNLLARVPLSVRSSVMRGSMAARVHRFFETLAGHGTRVSLVFTEADPGLAELRHYFGPGGRDLRHPNVAVSVLPDSDHNLTTSRASRWMLEHMIACAITPAPRGAAHAERPAHEPRAAAYAG